MLSDELAIERLEMAYDRAMSRYGNGIYDPEEEAEIRTAISGRKPKMLIPGETDIWGNPLNDKEA